MRVAIVHDWLNGMRGGEKVLEAILELYPGAVIYTLFHERGKVSTAIESREIRTSWLNSVPGIYRYYRNLLPLFPAAIESLDLQGYDLVISSSHSVAKGVRARNAAHLCYCHTPARYLWDGEDDYSISGLQHAALSLVRTRLRRWDCETATRVDSFIANSKFVAERISCYYGRVAEVLHPPIDTDFYTPSPSKRRGDYYLAVGALVRYKRFDLVVAAFNKARRPLIVAGDGPEIARLRTMAGPNVEIRGRVSDQELRQLYRTARALVFAGREDFGMVSVEAQACGCPVIAFSAGGSIEIVNDGLNGLLFAEQRTDDLIQAVRRFEGMTWPEEQVRNGVEGFSRETFKRRFREAVESRTRSQETRPQLSLQPA